ncbi:OmpP1/FadL family transporter [Thiomicrospira sp. S5]|uniref:OmpP1/FadL family transporter n=1 Tax=Thiomicrospira sp. S5 TaxID=1803865 RepID=UPI000F8A0FDF|nr:outer membrane protein transport protein [Thiomicrospira sp. S5]AZR82746.1 aromatic hydrocarbon degradation protein [Thiomicrospira sp. S5]
MKKTRLALAIAATAMASTPVLATNGDNLIGLGAQSRALGGTGTAAFFGSENALTNPALLGKSQGTEFAIGGTLFKPDVKATSNVANPAVEASQTSDNDTNIIPEVSLSTRINENWTFGLGIFGSAGMGVDYRDNDGLFNGYSNLQLMKFAPTLSYNDKRFGIGLAPVIQYGALDINYKNASGTIGNGMSSDIAYGYNLGGYFDITSDLTVALSYQSAIDMKYKDQITTAAAGFGLTGFTDHLEQPAEIKAGVAYTMGSFMLTADAKQIKWGDAKGYKDFNWKDQNVFGVGAKYTGNGYWAGIGYNYGEDPIDKLDESNTNPSAYANQATNMFNNHFFPGIVESHFTFGGGYSLTKNLALDGAIVYAPEVSKTINTTAVTAGLGGSGASEHEVKHSQMGYTLSLRMNF